MTIPMFICSSTSFKDIRGTFAGKGAKELDFISPWQKNTCKDPFLLDDLSFKQFDFSTHKIDELHQLLNLLKFRKRLSTGIGSTNPPPTPPPHPPHRSRSLEALPGGTKCHGGAAAVVCVPHVPAAQATRHLPRCFWPRRRMFGPSSR